MAPKFLLFLLLLSTVYTVNSSVVDVALISRTLFDRGYNAMTLNLEMALADLIPSNISSSSFTIFCPHDRAFINSKYSLPPFTLLQYHVVPFKLDTDLLRQWSSLSHSLKVDTLLPGHTLVISPDRRTDFVFINNVKITEWNIYNDGFVIVHGVEDFFDPAYQTLFYPSYDGEGDTS